MRVALVHDYLNQYGGAERVLEALTEIFPEASIHTLFYDEKLTHSRFLGKTIFTSFLQKMPAIKNHHHFFMPLMPYAAKTLDLSDYDLVFSDSASYGKGIKIGQNTIHICYCHTPLRYAWEAKEYLKEYPISAAIKFFLPPLLVYLRNWDKKAASRIDYFIANSGFIAGRIRRYYEREAEVIYPPYDENRFFFSRISADPLRSRESEVSQNADKRGYYLAIGRFMHYKKFDLVIRTFNKMAKNLLIVGGGPEEARLKKLAGPTIEFRNFTVNSEELRNYYTNAKACIFPQLEDFGLTAVEAMACGTPVIAYGAGGVKESVKEGLSGIFFERQDENCLKEAVEKFEKMEFNREEIALYAKKFGKERFKKEIADFVSECLSC